MPGRPPGTVDAYLALLRPDARAALERVRRAIQKAVPEAEECISYRIPAFRFGGRILLYFAAWAEHYSIYPTSDAMVEVLGEDIAAHRVSKGTLRFALDRPVPVTLIGRIAKFRAGEMAGVPKRWRAAKTT
jgi:uncharacterized protein YdhG (YjbR/CyaY superfamily)